MPANRKEIIIFDAQHGLIAYEADTTDEKYGAALHRLGEMIDFGLLSPDDRDHALAKDIIAVKDGQRAWNLINRRRNQRHQGFQLVQLRREIHKDG